MFELKVQIKGSNSALEHLETTLHSWLHVVREYTYRVPKDLNDPNNKDYAWWSKERPQVGFLAIAAWLNGWAVLEEWGTRKSDGWGRNDLWIGRGETEFFIEAKQGCCFIEEDEEIIEKRLREHFVSAQNSARQLVEEKRGKRIAAVFITPSWRLSDQLGFEKAREVWIQKVSHVADAVALIVPSWNNCARGKDGHRYVGSALLLATV